LPIRTSGRIQTQVLFHTSFFFPPLLSLLCSFGGAVGRDGSKMQSVLPIDDRDPDSQFPLLPSPFPPFSFLVNPMLRAGPKVGRQAQNLLVCRRAGQCISPFFFFFFPLPCPRPMNDHGRLARTINHHLGGLRGWQPRHEPSSSLFFPPPPGVGQIRSSSPSAAPLFPARNLTLAVASAPPPFFFSSPPSSTGSPIRRREEDLWQSFSRKKDKDKQ